MENQKDTTIYQKDTMSVTRDNALNIKLFSEFSYKKTEKLATALYMVSDCLEDVDPIKQKLRTHGVDLMSFMHKVALSRGEDILAEFSRSKFVIDEILSLVNIASIMGHISDMNAEILRKEFGVLIGEIDRFVGTLNISKSSNSSSPFTQQTELDPNSFSIALPVYEEPKKLVSSFWAKREESKGHQKDTIPNVLYKKDLVEKVLKTSTETKDNVLLIKKEEREIKLLEAIKDISQKFKKTDVSIKDISFLFKDFSEKTIQRDLNNLVISGKLKKEGNKRWSRYSII